MSTLKLVNLVLEANKSQKENIYNKKSELWDGYFNSRTGEYDIKILETFLDPDSNQTEGTSDWGREISNDLLEYYKESINISFLSKCLMPSTGSPKIFKLLEYDVSTPYLWNLTTISVFYEMMRGHLKKEKNDVVEIGAGFGCGALMWIQLGLVRSYTIVDLTENAINSAYYLSQNLPGWDVNVCMSPLTGITEKTINIVLPGMLHHIDICSFDIAINSDSLGEMPASTCKAYVKWIHQHLNDTGIFISKNGHRRGEGHVESVSEYGYDSFSLLEFRPSYVCSTLFDDFSHFIILRKTGKKITSEYMKYIDILSNLFACGIQQDISSLCKRLSHYNLNDEDVFLLSQCGMFFQGESQINIEGSYSHILSYCKGLRSAAENNKFDPSLIEYAEKGESYVAKVYCSLISSYFKKNSDIFSCSDAGFKLYIREVNNFEKCSLFNRYFRYRVRLENIKKKTTPYKKWTPSLLLKLKNFVLSIKQGTFNRVRPIQT